MTDTSIARYCVIGHPIAHSRSPWIHARFAEQTGQSIRYEAIDSPPDAFAATLQRLKKAGYAGCNVTVPFKHEAFAAAQSHTPRATLAQAANTLVWQRVPGKRSLVLHADNTDGPASCATLSSTPVLFLAACICYCWARAALLLVC